MTPNTAARRRRFSAAEEAFMGDQARLMAYLNNRLPSTEWHCAEQLVCETWLEALEATEAGVDVGGEEDGLEGWLAAAARRVVARRSYPVRVVPSGDDVHWELLTQVLGHTSDWPEHWHQALVRGGQAVLLKTAVKDMAGPAASGTGAGVPARVVPLPSAMPRRSAPAAAAA